MISSNKYLRNCFIILTALLSISGNATPSVKLTVTPDRGKRTIEVGDRFYISIEVNNLDGEPKMASSIPGAKTMFFDHTGQYSNVTNINGQVTRNVLNEWTATMRASKEGSFAFGPISVSGVKSNIVKYNIGKASEDSPNLQQSTTSGSTQQDTDKPQFIGKGDGNLFLKASVNETNIFEQQAIVYTVKLYTTYDAIKFIGAASAPKFDGFVVEESKDISTSFNFETYNGKSYATAVIAKYIIFPQMTGQLKVKGNTYTVSVDQREYYHDPFWGQLSVAKPLQLNVTPNDLIINVKQLPSPKPSNFSGGVGKFTISSQLKSNDFKTNQVASIVYTITGIGNLKYIQLPDLSTVYPNQIEVYTPTTDVKTHVGSADVSGSISFDYSFMPLEEGNFTLPKIDFVYFNPASGKYETTTSKSYDITVGKGTGSSKSQVSNRYKFNGRIEKLDSSSLKKTHKPNIYKFSFWLWYIIPVLLLCAAVGYNEYDKNIHSDMLTFNSKRANRQAKKRLRKAANYLRKGDVDKFYDEILTALWGYLSDKLKMPTSELMRDNIIAVLEQRGIAEEYITNLVNIIDDCEFAKYSPESGKQSMSEAYDSAMNIINNLDKSFKKD